MATPTKEEPILTLRFGGGVHTRASEDMVSDVECTTGQNFDLDGGNDELRPRAPFDFLGKVPNSAEIRGFVTLLKSDGTVSTLVQAGAVLYQWDGEAGFTSVGACSATCKLRGRLEHNWQLDDRVIVTDLNGVDGPYSWNGTTWAAISYLRSNGSTAFGTFKPKYCYVHKERAIYANVTTATATPHLIVGSERGRYDIVSTTDRPSSSLSEEDPFFLIQPDYMAINGLTRAFNAFVTSSRGGSTFILSGESAKDFNMDELYPRSGAKGDEAMIFAGNDVYYGRQGRIESLASTDRYGDVLAQDLSRWISDEVAEYNNWLLVWNARTQRAYCHPVGESRIWTLHRNVLDYERAACENTVATTRSAVRSPWSKWVTNHAFAFNPTAMMNVLDPGDGLEYVLMGDASGNVYRLEGTLGGGDGGTATIDTKRTSKLYTLEANKRISDLQGYVRYKKNAAINLRITAKWAGESVKDEQINLAIPAATINSVWGGGYYWGGGSAAGHWGISGLDRWSKRNFRLPGHSNYLQLSTEVDTDEDFAIGEIGCRFTAVT